MPLCNDMDVVHLSHKLSSLACILPRNWTPNCTRSQLCDNKQHNRPGCPMSSANSWEVVMPTTQKLFGTSKRFGSEENSYWMIALPAKCPGLPFCYIIILMPLPLFSPKSRQVLKLGEKPDVEACSSTRNTLMGDDDSCLMSGQMVCLRL